MPRPPNPDVRARLLATGGQVVHSRGFNGSGVQDITAAAGVPKGSFYNYFDSKEAFAIELLEQYWLGIETRHFPLLRDTSQAPAARLARFFRALADDHGQHNFAQGCLVGNLSLELATESDDARRRLMQLFQRWEDALADCVAVLSHIGTGERAHDVAGVLIEAWEGAVLRAKVQRNRDPYLRFERMVLPKLLA